MQLQRFSLADLVRQVIDEQAFLSVNRQVSFSAQSGKDLQALCDPVLVSEIIGNFLSNADKYSSADTAIAVYIYQEDRWVCCQVQDQGRGISKADLPHIFQRYFRAGSVADVAGTGIGLYVAAELAALQRGKVTVRSDENSGSIFTLCLPHHFNK